MTRTAFNMRGGWAIVLAIGLAWLTPLHAQQPPAKTAPRKVDDARVAAEVTRLLKQIEQQQSGQDPWAKSMKKLIELGPDAVPALIRELNQTPVSVRRRLRTIPFILRGIGDKRAVPALIQALPKCYGQDGSDMGYLSNDPELLAFMRKHDDDLEDRDPTGYNYGRPINEVRTALIKLTGTTHGEIELCHIHERQGTPLQHYLKRALFIRCAERWARWWRTNWQDHLDDPSYAKVVVPDLNADAEVIPLNRKVSLTVGARMSNMLCESIWAKKQYRVFYDIDTGRGGPVHRRWKGKVTRENAGIISKWAISEGYDLMGDEVELDGKRVYVLRLLNGEAWEVPFDQYWSKYQPTSAEALIEGGRPVKDILAVVPVDERNVDYLGTGAFLIITSDGTPAMLRLGIEVHDDTIRTGSPSPQDNELNPKALCKGRRFALRLLQEPSGDQ